MKYEVLIDERSYQIDLERTASGYACKVNGEPFPLDVVTTAPNTLSILHQGRSFEVMRELMREVTGESSSTGEMHLRVGSQHFRAEVRDPRSLRSRRAHSAATAGPARICAPMPGKVIRLLAAEGDQVEAGQGLIVVEAMKMQNEIQSTKPGKVTKIAVREASAVNAGDLLVIVE
ncbi:MAG: biotin/lipoyl-containing protein [Candidatus Korobacteraceae bacterium]